MVEHKADMWTQDITGVIHDQEQVLYVNSEHRSGGSGSRRRLYSQVLILKLWTMKHSIYKNQLDFDSQSLDYEALDLKQ